ncbi:MAG: radical SAM protein [Methanoregulaceae archaeon]
MHSFVYGPVFSRRLGRSLGIDLIPHKTCPFDCSYCECGKTTCLTRERALFFPAENILSALDQVMASRPDLDYITFAGSGEPTLSLALGTVIRHIKKTYPDHRVAVLTNGSLCGNEDIIADLLPADLIVPTLTTAWENTFSQIHRPLPGIPVHGVIEGLTKLRKAFFGEIWLELFLIPGLNTTPSEITSIREALLQIQPDRVQLNTLDRRGTDVHIQPASLEDMEKICKYLEKVGLTVDVIGPEFP